MDKSMIKRVLSILVAAVIIVESIVSNSLVVSATSQEASSEDLPITDEEMHNEDTYELDELDNIDVLDEISSKEFSQNDLENETVFETNEEADLAADENLMENIKDEGSGLDSVQTEKKTAEDSVVLEESTFITVEEDSSEEEFYEDIEKVSDEGTHALQKTEGNFANVIIFVNFNDTDDSSDELELGASFWNDLDVIFETFGDGENSRGLKQYLENTSYGELQLANIYPQYDAENDLIIPYQLENSSSYYSDHYTELLEEIIYNMQSSGQIIEDIDRNADGIIDNITIVIPSTGADLDDKFYNHGEWYEGESKFEGKEIKYFNVLTENDIYSDNNGLVVHEFLHTLGYPDLFHENGSGTPVGKWDIMGEPAWQYPLVYLRYFISGWLDIPVITESWLGYQLNSVSGSMKDTQGVILKTDYSDTEFFVLEYRKQNTNNEQEFDCQIPGSGLLIYRVNLAYASNKDGAPDMIYIFRPDERNDENGYETGAGKLEDAFLSAESGRTTLGIDIPITYSDGTDSGIVIENIGSASGDQITFDIVYAGKEDGGDVQEIRSLRYDPESGEWYVYMGEKNDYEYTGLVQNENGWWYVSGGKVNFNYTSVILYEGSWWYVKNGKLEMGYTGLAKNEYGWWYIRKGKVDFNYSSVVPYNGSWWYVKNGKLDFNYTGVVQNENGWWRIEKGKVNFNYTGIAQNEHGWWRIEKGKVNFSYTGLAQNENGWWYVKNGKVDFNYNSVVPYNGKWYCVINGKVDAGYTGIAKNANGWWRIEKGIVKFNYTGLAQNENGWWYIHKGKVDFNYSSVVPYNGGWWYVKNGKLDFNYTGVAKNENGWWRIKNGKVDFTYTGVAQNENGWWRIEKGKVNFNYTGLAQNENGWWYIKNGKLDWNFSSVVSYNGSWWYVKNGKLDFNYTGVAKNENGWWRIKNGKVDFSYTGVAKNENGWWYIRNGKLDWNYCGLAQNENGWWYIWKGALDWSYTGVVRYGQEWFYVNKGHMDWNYTGIASNENGWWYIRNGKLDWSYSGQVMHNGVQYSVVKGCVQLKNSGQISLLGCVATAYDGKQMTVTLSTGRNQELESLYDTFYVLMMNSSGTMTIGTFLGHSEISSKIQVNATFSSGDAFKTPIMSKYAIAVKKGRTYQVISNTGFLSNPEITATMTKTYLGYYDNDKISSKKGLQGASEDYTETTGVQHVLLNVDVADLVSTRACSGYVPYYYKGKTYYFQDMIALVQTMRYLNGWDNDNPYGWHSRSVTLVLLLSWDDELSYLIHPTARSKGAAPYYAFNMKEENARNTYEALFCYMGEKLGENKTIVSNWTLGNEVNSCRAWNYSGNMTLSECVENYAQAFQLLYQGVKRTASTSRVFISLDHCWNTTDGGHTGKTYLDEFASYMNRTAPNMQWNVNYHPYSQPLTRTKFWSDDSNTVNSVNTAYISMKNIQVLTNYLSDLEKQYGKSSGSIRVILGEIGFSGNKGCSSSEAEQAAALGYGYYIAMFNSRIDAYIIRAYLDDPTEMRSGLYFGLMNGEHEMKQAFDVYKNLDTKDSLTYMNRYLSTIGIPSWQSVISGFDASKLSAVDF